MNRNNYCVYKHTSPSGKVYIGITGRKPSERWKDGKGYKHQKYFYNAIKKYGWNNFEHEILIDHITREEAKEKLDIHFLDEQQFIEQYHSYFEEHGYNISKGGVGSIVINFGIALLYKDKPVSVYSSYEDAASDFGYTNGTSFKKMMNNHFKINDYSLVVLSKEEYLKYKDIRNKEYAILYKKYCRQFIKNEQSKRRKGKHGIKAVRQIDNNTLQEVCLYDSIKHMRKLVLMVVILVSVVYIIKD